MAVKTTRETHHARRHSVCRTLAFHDLSARRPSDRAGYARWLSTTDCADCWKAGRDAAAARERAAWLAGRRAEELAETEAWATRTGMPPLEGSDKAMEWGRQVRYELLAAAHDTLGVADNDFAERVENPARHLDSASWWIDQRDTTPADLEELVTDAAANETGASSSENPY